MELRYQVTGPEDGPLLVLGPSLGTTTHMLEAQAAELSRSWRVLRYDHPGHGSSPAAKNPFTIEDLARAVLALADEDRFAIGGVSLGGAVALAVAALAPERVTDLVLCCTAARFGEPGPWHERAARVRAEGMGWLAGIVTARWFTLGVDPEVAEPVQSTLLGTDPESYALACEAVAAFDLRDALRDVRARTLVIAGDQDPATPVEYSEVIADGIPGARLAVVPDAAHLANVERAPVVGGLMARFLGHGVGLKTRREVLGDPHVDRARAAVTDFTADFQEFITRYAWGEIWTRPGLDRRTRSCITLTALVARGQLEELAMHVRAALRNGLTPDEIKEVLLHSAIYCGLPAANAAFAVAQKVLNEDI
ncbi:3-oxoadipate enol-lactonase [Sphaerisporangium siamense]|uniref:3-oxoadipate enol-lactonase/4-carboxymuconolactone decarboxylase n=1 Tax=Sphaerisporangium siamense TaxID=795645 RepID=A0A7W7GAS8_9ACTN|nr:4-carboxymuconolactone decarboxylase [Sphaerisporangium siamense]MBB4701739.1 3-oxoadipate enol-lactonase/4-carboxymuconolactone decarboxylase [Sphaerisporangium siamense]GII84356.1 3-oxoadipate enol-lactonase [Sphaerisporangium siamense]